LKAGKGSVFTRDGKKELDAFIIDGKSRMAGEVAGITTIKNPIETAKRVGENSVHLRMMGGGPEIFAEEQDVKIFSLSYFVDSL
jgi:beta-aspartyl-peptidase (threonine type)